MIEAVMFWNEPNNKSHWDFAIDPEWSQYAHMVKLAASAAPVKSSLTEPMLTFSPWAIHTRGGRSKACASHAGEAASG